MYADIINIVSSELQSVYIRLRHLGLGFFQGYKCFSPKREWAQTVLGKIPIQTQHSQSRLDAGIHIFHLGRCCSNASHCSTRCLWQNHFWKKKKTKQQRNRMNRHDQQALRSLPAHCPKHWWPHLFCVKDRGSKRLGFVRRSNNRWGLLL